MGEGHGNQAPMILFGIFIFILSHINVTAVGNCFWTTILETKTKAYTLKNNTKNALLPKELDVIKHCDPVVICRNVFVFLWKSRVHYLCLLLQSRTSTFYGFEKNTRRHTLKILRKNYIIIIIIIM